MKIKQIELGDTKEKTDTAFLWNKSHTRSIILKYSFDELEKLVAKEKSDDNSNRRI